LVFEVAAARELFIFEEEGAMGSSISAIFREFFSLSASSARAFTRDL
jgi:hypothetical protein